ncbi:unnamed protein product [Cylicocyclus nassatus]|uniref:Uncharacterized protein n=1 Tax=Cylicocyclus nassatus TaxID=53992 RepID=A0AA36GUM6_CYLNA|nr:unnamed protein product [Cylicocyclus nassatus]
MFPHVRHVCCKERAQSRVASFMDGRRGSCSNWDEMDIQGGAVCYMPTTANDPSTFPSIDNDDVSTTTAMSDKGLITDDLADVSSKTSQATTQESDDAVDAFGRCIPKNRAVWQTNSGGAFVNYKVLTGEVVPLPTERAKIVELPAELALSVMDMHCRTFEGSEEVLVKLLSSSNKKYMYGTKFEVAAGVWTLFWDPMHHSKLTTFDIQSAICAALNSRRTLAFVIGVDSNKEIVGCDLSPQAKKTIRDVFEDCIHTEFVPPLDEGLVKLRFRSVCNQFGCEIPSRFLVGITVQDTVTTLYQLSSSRIYYADGNVVARVKNLTEARNMLLLRRQKEFEKMKNAGQPIRIPCLRVPEERSYFFSKLTAYALFALSGLILSLVVAMFLKYKLPFQNYSNGDRDVQRKILAERMKILGEKQHNREGKRAQDQPLSEQDHDLLVQIADAVERYKRDPFTEAVNTMKKAEELAQHVSHSDSDLREREGDSDVEIKEEGFIEEHDGSDRKLKEKEGHEDTEETDEHLNRTRAPSEGYCDSYEQHFSFYCIGESDRGGENQKTIAKFCPSYKKACPHKSITASIASSELPSNPSNPFTKKTAFRAPVISSEEYESSEERLTSEEEEAERKEAYYSEIKRRFPCKPDCDQRIFPHCTPECKCDYIYPAVQKFCNPPPLPLFLNTCRLWYHGCPKYEQYHYSSQYIYSKAEKGKKLAGPYLNNPVPLPAPPVLTPAYAPHLPSREARGSYREQYSRGVQRLQPVVHSSITHALPPPLPKSVVRDYLESASTQESKSARKRRRHRERRSRSRTFSTHRHSHKTQSDTKTRELYRALRAINSLTSEPVKIVRDPAKLLSGPSDGTEDGTRDGAGPRPRAHQSKNIPVVPSEAAYGASDNAFKKFDGLTDSAGVLHRPRSRSPFVKPGLWEPNPDDPHNRDHANKFYYAPRSVGVDWLNGQIAWGAHWAVPAAGTGGTDGFSAVHFPTIGTFLNIPDDYD